MPESSVDKIFVSMLQPKAGLKYYQVDLMADSQNRIWLGAYTHWISFTCSEPRREIREGSLVRPEIMIDSWQKLSVPYWVVSTEAEMIAYLCCGGPALVEKRLGEVYFADVIAPNECAYDSPSGFKSVQTLPEQALFRAPRPKLRMTVLKRDQYRCRLCGRRPADYADLVLHVHHIKPWATGGLTEAQNLICLCHTCHNGLSPHEEPRLFNLIGIGSISVSGYAKGIVEGMVRYHHLMRQRLEREMALEKAEKTSHKKKTHRTLRVSARRQSRA